MYGSSYGGYGGSYGSGLYGNNMYRGGYGGLYGGGGGMYGGGMYGGGYGGAMGGYGGMGMGGPYGDQDPNSPFNSPPSPPGFWISLMRVVSQFSTQHFISLVKNSKSICCYQNVLWTNY